MGDTAAMALTARITPADLLLILRESQSDDFGSCGYIEGDRDAYTNGKLEAVCFDTRLDLEKAAELINDLLEGDPPRMTY